MSQFSLNRRSFLQATGALGLGAMIGRSSLFAQDNQPPPIAKRHYGRTGVEVPILGLGCMFDTIGNQMVLEEAYRHGITYWDTAASYGKGASERGIGQFLAKHPDARKDLFIVTKASRSHGTDDMTRLLNESLDRMKIDQVDLYFMHGVSNIDLVNRPEIRTWAENAKKAGKIRFFGFSTHAGMEDLLLGASKLGWIDGIMTTFNFQNMDSDAMKLGIHACEKAGIGLTAMKVIGTGPKRSSAETDTNLANLTGKGYTLGQAKVKLVLENKSFSTACVQMPNLQLFQENFAAATDIRPLTAADREALRSHAKATCGNYCAGCSHLCEGAIANAVPVRDVLRYVMYHENYGLEAEARELLAELPADVRTRLARFDFSAAEASCPNRLPIGELMSFAGKLQA